MADGVVGGGRSNGGGGTPPVAPLPQELDVLLSKYVLFHMYLLKAVTGLGYLALTWSTVVLLGGFITALTKKDFWCITIISLMQAARIFHDLADQLLPNFFKLVTHIIRHNHAVVRYRMCLLTKSFRGKEDSLFTVAKKVAYLAFVVLAVLPFLVICYVPAFLYVYGGPVVCIALAIWRTVQRDYGDDDGDSSGKANLAPALDMFYSLVLLQGGLLLVWLYHESWWVDHLITLRQHCKLPNTEWCRLALVEFLCDTRERCWRNLSSIRGRKLVDYAVGLLDSGSWDDNLSGARLLHEFIRQGSDVRSLLLPSRPKIQKLIDSLGWRDGRRLEDAEMRKLAARIVAHLAGDLHLAQFPGAIRCISYLLQDEATLAYSEQQRRLSHRPHRRLASEKEAMILRLKKRELEREARRNKEIMKRLQRHAVPLQQQQQQHHQQQHQHLHQHHQQQQQQQVQQQQQGGGRSNELILQGLAILERLACDRHNCSDICSSPGLLHKITAPLYSGTMVQDIHVVSDWVHIVNATFKVVCQLIHAPGETSTRLRTEIAGNNQAMSNLEAIIRQEAQRQEMKMRAMEILTELALDSCIDLPGGVKETLTNSLDPLLVPILDDDNIEYRMIAAEILENMCVHCDKQRVKDTLLPKVLTMIMSVKRKEIQTGNAGPGNIQEIKGRDEENQYSSALTDQKRTSDHGNEDQTATKEMQARLLSLTLAIYDKLISADDFGTVLQNLDVSPDSFVAKLKAIVEENCQFTIFSLKIVKLCGKIAISMIQRNQYTEQFKNKKFVDALIEASKTMSNLESCMLFSGTQYRQQMTVERPLSSLVEATQQLVG